jgi:hypothetical protein
MSPIAQCASHGFLRWPMRIRGPHQGAGLARSAPGWPLCRQKRFRADGPEAGARLVEEALLRIDEGYFASAVPRRKVGVNIWRISNHRDLAARRRLACRGQVALAGPGDRLLRRASGERLLEILAHLMSPTWRRSLDGYQLLEIDVPAAVEIESLPTHALTLKWQSDDASTQAIGDRWLASRSSALLRVPSALVPKVWNYLINPSHPALRRYSRSRPQCATPSTPACSSWSWAGGAKRRPAARMRRR